MPDNPIEEKQRKRMNDLAKALCEPLRITEQK